MVGRKRKDVPVLEGKFACMKAADAYGNFDRDVVRDWKVLITDEDSRQWTSDLTRLASQGCASKSHELNRYKSSTLFHMMSAIPCSSSKALVWYDRSYVQISK